MAIFIFGIKNIFFFAGIDFLGRNSRLIFCGIKTLHLSHCIAVIETVTNFTTTKGCSLFCHNKYRNVEILVLIYLGMYLNFQYLDEINSCEFCLSFTKTLKFFPQNFLLFLHKCFTSTMRKIFQNTGFLKYPYRRFCPYARRYRSEKTSILAHFAQCYITIIFTYFYCTLPKR